MQWSVKDYFDEYSEFISATIICLTKNIVNIPSHFCFCHHDGDWMPCIGPHVLVANILMHEAVGLEFMD